MGVEPEANLPKLAHQPSHNVALTTPMDAFLLKTRPE